MTSSRRSSARWPVHLRRRSDRSPATASGRARQTYHDRRQRMIRSTPPRRSRTLLTLFLALFTLGCSEPKRQVHIEDPPASRPESRSKKRHSSHEHPHGSHPHAGNEHHHHPHPHPHLDG